MNKKFAQDHRFQIMSKDSKFHDTIDQLIKIVDDNLQQLYEQEIKIPFPSEKEYSTKHLTKLY